jgi:hypothetical protein
MPRLRSIVLIAFTVLAMHVANAQTQACRISTEQASRWFAQTQTQLAAPVRALESLESITTAPPSVNAQTSYTLCTAWPAQPGLRLVLLSLPQAKAPNEGEYKLDALLLAVNAQQQVQAYVLLPNYLSYDLVKLTRVRFDTARYLLSQQTQPATMAFGIKQGFEGPSRVSQFAAEHLDLFVIDGQRIRQVLKNLTTRLQRLEWNQSCEAEGQSIRRIVQVLPTRTEDYFDLLIKQTGTQSQTRFDKNKNCVDKSKPMPKQQWRLRYDSNHYALPGGLK